MNAGIGLHNVWEFECYDKDGNLKWKDGFTNLTTTEGLNHILDVEFHATTQVTTWYVGLVNNSPTPSYAAGDTMAQIGGTNGWTEFTTYTGNRQAYVEAAASSGVTTNTASKAAFPITGTATIDGGFLCSAATGTSGILFGEGAFSSPGDRSVVSGDTLNVTITITATST